ncbi:MAG: ribose-phosphate pyrophosphokinase [Acidobacteria bacterium]|nr:ribose-phosphate pyrophosphokinase [Acidobacteriota bacterium]
MKKNDRPLVFSGRGNPNLAQEIAKKLKIALGEIKITNFADGETYCQILENVRGRDTFIIQPTSTPVNQNLMELLIMIDAFKRASARRITAVIPYYGYARQDRKDKPRVPITSRLVADLIQTAGADRILCMDVHAAQIQGFFKIPVDHLFAAPVLINYIKSLKLKNMTIVSPDAGGVERARAYAKRLDAELAIIDKRRETANVAEVMNIVGNVKGKTCVIVDDMVDTAGTLCESVKTLMRENAKKVYCAATHAVLSKNALSKLEEAPLEQLIVTNTIDAEEKAKQCKKIKVLSVASLLAEAIKRIHEESSVSSLFV